MTRLSADRIRELARTALTGQQFPQHFVDDVVEEFVRAELSGRPSHGLGKLAAIELGSFVAQPEFVNNGPVLVVNGAGANGFVLLRAVALRLADLAELHGIGLAAVRNFSRYAALYPYPEILARRGLVGILMNNAGPAAVAPHGSTQPITGTNPICFSFPTATQPQTIDFSTAERVWGEIRQATFDGQELPEGPFLDEAGQVTTTPSEVNAVRSFGGPRGFGLNLAIELLAGALVGANSGLSIRDEFDCGALMIAIRPDAVGAAPGFGTAVTQLLDEVRQTRPEPDRSPVRAPGDRHRQPLPDSAEVADSVVDLLEAMAAGERNALSANPLLN